MPESVVYLEKQDAVLQKLEVALCLLALRLWYSQ